ncbi:hypothetical protein AVEN_153002-1 [Araneus ventricosus]|uniref:Reverse transcriptase domain-containing protein n=1 Tax=Araneus ventricosus TaxID=182803 RepID=A0A4Y2AFS5_ARAVE|nr:hypothetical protein AVEN_153002-1 [Araneus ventricosus]
MLVPSVDINGALDSIQHQSIVNYLDNLNCPSTLGIYLKIFCNQEKSFLTRRKARPPENKNRAAPKDLAADLLFGTWWRMVSFVKTGRIILLSKLLRQNERRSNKKYTRINRKIHHMSRYQ